jgi:hypothetical protein
MFTGEWNSLYNMETERQEVYLPRIPEKGLKVEHTTNIYVRKVGNACCTEIRGYLAGNRASRIVWDAWPAARAARQGEDSEARKQNQECLALRGR